MSDSKKNVKKDEYVVTDKLTAQLGEIDKWKKLIKRKNSAGKNSDYEVISRL